MADETENTGSHPEETRRLSVRTFGSLAIERGAHELLAQPKSLAVLVYLAIESRDGFCRRDTLAGAFWADSTQERARASLRNALYTLRRHLPEGSIESAGDEMIRVVPELVPVDAAVFETALVDGRFEDALDLYRGEFLPGVHVPGADTFEAWREGREQAYRRAALSAAMNLAESDPRTGDAWLERAIAIAPLDDDPVRRLVERLIARGDVAAAVSAYLDHERRLAPLELAPSTSTRALIEAAAVAIEPGGSDRLTEAAWKREPFAEVGDAATRRRGGGSEPADTPRSARRSGTRMTRRAALGLASAACVLILATHTRLEARRAETEGMATLRAHVESGDFVAAHRTALGLSRWLEGDEVFETLWGQATYVVDISTGPGPARVAIRDYRHPDSEWIELGDTPLQDVRVPATYLRWRIERPGRTPVERAALDMTVRDYVHFELAPDEDRAGMAFVSGDALNVGAPRAIPLAPYWMDRHEVSNRAFAAFVASADYPVDPAFRDRSGVPGPSTWMSGRYPPGQADHPVSGVSWHEADAYCRWAGRELPTIYHWYAAGGFHAHSDIIELSNFGGHGPESTLEGAAIGPYGHTHLAGNVREWVATDAGGLRYILGGAWDTPPYLFFVPDAADPADRSTHNGFRCADSGLPEAHASRSPLPRRNRVIELPVDDVGVDARLSHFEFDPTPLRPELDSISESLPNWRREFVSFEAAYGDERLAATLFIPRTGAPPYPTVVYHPGADANHLADSKAMHTTWFDFFSAAGYAVVHPVYQGTFERRRAVTGPVGVREQVIQRVQDVRRTLDYLEGRADLDLGDVVFYGFSEGGVLAPVVAAVEDRIAAVVVLSGGLLAEPIDAVVDPARYLGLVDVPLLMVGGELDFIFPVDRNQRTYFDGWGTPPDEKRFVTLSAGHAPRDLRPVARAVLGWLGERARRR